MTSNEAAAVIRAMSRSLAANPAQFDIQINMTGQQVTSHGGTGIQIAATGGGRARPRSVKPYPQALAACKSTMAGNLSTPNSTA
jgi:hypothetical protein